MNKRNLSVLILSMITFVIGICIIIISLNLAMNDLTIFFPSYSKDEIMAVMFNNVTFSNSLMLRYKLAGILISLLGGVGVIKSLFSRQ